MYLLVLTDDLEGCHDLLYSSTTTNIQKVCWLATMQLNDIHGGHGQAGTIHWSTQENSLI